MIEQIEWVPASERLPADGESVLSFAPNMGGETWPGWRIGHAWRWADAMPVTCEVTHWAPLPAVLELAAKAAGVRERHGMNKSPEHHAWVHMKQRCGNPNKREYAHYGGRGIKVCDEWMRSFLAFYSHIGPRPSSKHSLDRIDVNGNYEPGDVRWATDQEQKENTRVVRMIALDGKTQSVSAWEREMRLPKGTARRREAAGLSIEDAIKTPTVPGQKKHKHVKRDYSNYERDWHGRYKAA